MSEDLFRKYARPSMDGQCEDELLCVKQCAPLLGLAPQTLNRWRSEGIGPPYLKLGRTVRYSKQEVLAWARSQRKCA